MCKKKREKFFQEKLFFENFLEKIFFGKVFFRKIKKVFRKTFHQILQEGGQLFASFEYILNNVCRNFKIIFLLGS